MAASAASKVLAITELAESILAHLSLADLLVMHNVNVFFRNLINGSRTLQHIFTLLPDTAALDRRPFLSPRLKGLLCFTSPEYLDLQPFHFDRAFLTDTYLGTRAVQVDYKLYITCPERAAASKKPARTVSCAGTSEQPIGSSWHKIRVARAPISLNITVVCLKKGKEKVTRYSHTHFLSEERATLSVLAELMDELLAVRHEEHMRRASR